MSESWPSRTVELTVPAHEDFVAAVRAQTRSMAVLTSLGVDDVEELQMAIGEAATLLLPVVDLATPFFRIEFDLLPDGMRIALRARVRPGAAIDREGLAWMLLTALDPHVEVTGSDETCIVISRTRSNSRV